MNLATDILGKRVRIEVPGMIDGAVGLASGVVGLVRGVACYDSVFSLLVQVESHTVNRYPGVLAPCSLITVSTDHHVILVNQDKGS